MLVSSLLLALAPTLSLATVYTDPAKIFAPSYDFVIIGGGTAGSVLASRLTENKSVRVLIIEDGGNPDDVPAASVPFQAAALRASRMDYNFTTVPQAGLNNRNVYYARGRALGGSSSINVMAYNRGSDDVYNNWAKITGDLIWSWPLLKKYHRKTVYLADPADGHNYAGQVSKAAYGNGAVGVSVQGFKTPIDDTVIATAKSLGGRFAFTEDLGEGDATGIGYTPVTVSNGARSSAYTSYLKPIISRPNLDILLNTRALKLIHSGMSGRTPEFKVVQVAQSPSSQAYQFKATLEIIIATGVIGTPQLLQLSGIGPKAKLAEFGLSAIVDLPDVGVGLTDHPMVPTYYSFNNEVDTFDAVLTNSTVAAAYMAEYKAKGTGRYVVPPANTFGFFRLPPKAPIFKSFADPSNGPLSGHTELMFLNGFGALSTIPHPPAPDHYLTVLAAVVAPVGRGSVHISANDPWSKPAIDPKLMENDFDKYAIIQAIRDSQTILSQSAFSKFQIKAWGPMANMTTDDDILAYVRNYLITINHPVGTAKMSSRWASGGVVDPDLKVKDTAGLRIVDASVFPTVPEGHTQGAVYILAERAADLIKDDHFSPDGLGCWFFFFCF